MAFKVRFNGVDLMNDGEGNFSFPQGTFTPYTKGVEPMARSKSVLVRELAAEGAEHLVSLRYKAMDPAVVRARIKEAFEAGEGTLEVRGYENTPNCELMAPPPISDGQFSARYDTGGAPQVGMAFNVTLVFLQVAE